MATMPPNPTTRAGELPLPVPQQESDFYWEKCRLHELWLRRCNDCQTWHFYPRDICPACHSRNTEWAKASGRGEVFAFAIVHRPPMPAFDGRTPYVAALVRLAEGPLFPTNIVGVEPDPEKVRVGLPVEVVYEDQTDKISLPKFKPA
jgi:uncharacterized OB-fold protein